MTRPGRKRRSDEVLHRFGEIKQVSTSLSVRADKSRSLPPERKTMLTIDIQGEFTEPIAGISQFSIMAYVHANPVIGQAEVPAIGAFTAIKPVLRGGIDLSPSEFQSLLTMAAEVPRHRCVHISTSLMYIEPRQWPRFESPSLRADEFINWLI